MKIGDKVIRKFETSDNCQLKEGKIYTIEGIKDVRISGIDLMEFHTYKLLKLKESTQWFHINAFQLLKEVRKNKLDKINESR